MTDSNIANAENMQAGMIRESPCERRSVAMEHKTKNSPGIHPSQKIHSAINVILGFGSPVGVNNASRLNIMNNRTKETKPAKEAMEKSRDIFL
jgi:hypothetical protein